jgi:S-(hydroxymethyl)glutathione dehydrogenase/alcohol dehydrogenase
VKAGSTAALYGFGGVGSGALNGLVQSGADMIIVVEPREWKEEIARKMGATHFINPEKEDPVEKIRELTYGVGVDYAFECWGSIEVQGQCFSSIRNKGEAIFVGAPNMAHNEIPMNAFEFIVTEKIVKGSLQGSTVPKVDVPKFVSLYQHGKFDLDSVITKEFKLEEINEAFKAMADGDVIRGIIRY